MNERLPGRSIRFCGADCRQCDAYKRYLEGDEGGLVNPENGYRCCWLPRDYPEGRDCPIRLCCEEKGVRFCGECVEYDRCDRMQAFYSQPGYDKLQRRMLEQVAKR